MSFTNYTLSENFKKVDSHCEVIFCKMQSHPSVSISKTSLNQTNSFWTQR